MLSGKHIVVGISGGIAAYKMPEAIRLLRKAGAEVKVTCSRNALNFVTDLTLQTLSQNKVYSDVFAAINDHSTEHISLPDWADAMLIAPATADVICKLASGIADDALTTTAAAMRKPIIIAPAMNDKMYAAESLQQAMQTLSQRSNVTCLDSADGFLACGTNGRGRMQEPAALIEAVCAALTDKTMANKRVLITVGPTQEAIDPVRYISNRSTGKMGFAIATACLRHGAQVTLVAGPCSAELITPLYWNAPSNLSRIDVITAEQMFEATIKAWSDADIAILTAAVADLTPVTVADHKLKKGIDLQDSIPLKQTKDIAKALGDTKRANQQLIGFALETNDGESNAMHKLQSKNMDKIVLNSLSDAGAGFGTDTNIVTIFCKDGTHQSYPLASKQEVAEFILS